MCTTSPLLLLMCFVYNCLHMWIWFLRLLVILFYIFYLFCCFHLTKKYIFSKDYARLSSLFYTIVICLLIPKAQFMKNQISWTQRLVVKLKTFIIFVRWWRKEGGLDQKWPVWQFPSMHTKMILKHIQTSYVHLYFAFTTFTPSLTVHTYGHLSGMVWTHSPVTNTAYCCSFLVDPWWA